LSSDFWKPLRSLTFRDVEVLKESGQRERTVLDYKRFDPNTFAISVEKIADDFAAFANAGGGRLVFGAVEKDERVVDFAGAPKRKRKSITASLRNAAHVVQPPVDIEVVDVEIPKDKTFVFVVEIRSGQRGPFQRGGRYLQRVADGNVAMPHTSVVQAVLTSRRDQPPAGQKVVGTVLDGNPLGPLSQGWFFGVHLSPSYETDRTIYDAFSSEADNMVAWLKGHGYPKVVKGAAPTHGISHERLAS
jgi:hypothetical protein